MFILNCPPPNNAVIINFRDTLKYGAVEVTTTGNVGKNVSTQLGPPFGVKVGREFCP